MMGITPRQLQAMSSIELVDLAVADHPAFKDVAAELERRDADPAAAAAVVDAYRDGRAPPWLVAVLLGRVRAQEGYAVAREILLAAPGLLAESYAGPAMARIAGAAAREDLIDIMMSGARLASRKGAAYGLGALEVDGIAPTLLEAVKAGRVPRSTAGHIVGALPDAMPTVLAWLAGSDEIAEAMAVDAAFSLSANVGGITDTTLARAVRGALDARRVTLAPSIRKMLEERIAPLLERSGG
jgi:hypothetical protein